MLKHFVNLSNHSYTEIDVDFAIKAYRRLNRYCVLMCCIRSELDLSLAKSNCCLFLTLAATLGRPAFQTDVAPTFVGKIT